MINNFNEIATLAYSTSKNDIELLKIIHLLTISIKVGPKEIH